ncbi:ATP-binding cassette domain-containing protein [Sorangium sp. So ce1153]|uniref:ATP-binding cassette domain-containing protein n=1 Tax=Sorangium sp. So ce1153 TaxID=3133333 RepID=UPI003F63882F
MSSPARDRRRPHRAWLAPDVLQTSAMDCGPAALSCLLQGVGIPADTTFLRDLCRTDVDGTSIDDLEQVASDLGCPMGQLVLPADTLVEHWRLFCPCLFVRRLANGNQHFAVFWGRTARLAQVMDPADGRAWLRAAELRSVCSTHEHTIDLASWRALARTDLVLLPLRERLRALRLGPGGEALLAEALADPSAAAVARLDAATRFARALAEAAGGPPPARVCALVRRLAASEEAAAAIPRAFRYARVDEAEGTVALRGAVILRMTGPAVTAPRDEGGGGDAAAAPEGWLALVSSSSSGTGKGIARVLRDLLGEHARRVVPALAALALLLGAIVFVEAFVISSSVTVLSALSVPRQRLSALASAGVLILGLLGVETAAVVALRRLGRVLEMRFRVALAMKIPRLGDRYFKTRLASDMAERAHQIHLIRELPALAFEVVLRVAEALLVLAMLARLDASYGLVAAAMAASAAALSLLASGRLAEREGRVRTQAAAMGRTFLDALLGRMPLRTHGAERALASQHESVLVAWAQAMAGHRTSSLGLYAAQSLLGLAGTAAVVRGAWASTGSALHAAVVAFWLMRLTGAVRYLTQTWLDLPAVKTSILRVLEPLRAREAEPAAPPAAEADTFRRPVAVSLRDVDAAERGNTMLHVGALDVAPGEHVAVVGSSGAGKSTLLALLLGLQPPARGEIAIDGAPMDARRFALLRQRTAWVDPTVHLWNDTVMANVTYGLTPEEQRDLSAAISAADLVDLLRHLPDGMETVAGESGGSVSGGQGQRIRLARALGRGEPSLVLLDEPFRGLDRAQRTRLLRRARERWRRATLLCVTHDIDETLSFSRVLVVHEGRLVEDGDPRALAARSGSRFAQLLAAEELATRAVWGAARWRRARLDGGALVDEKGGALVDEQLGA